VSEVFEPRNDIEAKLLAAQEGELDAEEFMRELLGAQLFLPVRDDTHIGNFQRSTRAQPLALDGGDGSRVLVLFTSPERAKEFLKGHPGYGGGILTDLPWLFEHMGVGFGIALNPGWGVGLDLAPQEVEQLAGRGTLH
jgi:hypothetical protein